MTMTRSHLYPKVMDGKRTEAFELPSSDICDRGYTHPLIRTSSTEAFALGAGDARLHFNCCDAATGGVR